MILSESISKEVIKDLIRGDACQEELTQTQAIVSKQETQLNIQNLRIEGFMTRDKILNTVIVNKDAVISNKDVIEKELIYVNKTLKVKNTFLKIAVGVLAGSVTYLIIKN